MIKEIFEKKESSQNEKIAEYLNACLLLVKYKKEETNTFETDFFKKQIEKLRYEYYITFFLFYFDQLYIEIMIRRNIGCLLSKSVHKF